MASSSNSSDGTAAGDPADLIADAEIVETPPADLSDLRPAPEPSERQPAAAPVVQPPATRKSNPVLLILGGVVAAVLGYGVAQTVPNGWPIGGDPSAIAAVQTDLAAQSARNDQLAADLAALSGKLAELPLPDAGLTAKISTVEAAVAGQQSALDARLAELVNTSAAIDARLTVLERRPAAGGAVSEGALAAYEDEIKALRAMIETQQKQSATAGADIAAIAADATAQLQAAEARTLAMQTQAEATARTAVARAAVQRIQAALDAGGGFGSALDDLAGTGVTVPDGLDAIAAGVPTLRDLQAGFAEPARAALSASLKATVGDGALDRITAFLRNQVGARSLAAKAGPDPDAVLSRAEAALLAGDLAGTLGEIAALPPEGQAALAPWVALVQTRLTAADAVAALAAGLNG